MWTLRFWTPWVTALLLATTACDPPSTDDDAADNGDDDDDSDGSDTESGDDDGGDDGALSCHDALAAGPAALGDPCSNDTECRSFFCERYETFGEQGTGACAEPPPDCRSRSMGSLKDAVSDAPVVGATMFFGPATEMVTNPAEATRFAEAVTNEQGHFDMITEDPVKSFYAVLGAAVSDDLEPTVGFLGFPIDSQGNYEPAFGVRDFFGVKKADIEAWNDALEDDEEAAPYLPIEESASVVAIVASYYLEEKRTPGVTVAPAEPSGVVVRYLNEDGLTFNSTATSSNGVALLLGAQSGELFDANSEDMVIWDSEKGRPGTAQNGIYAMLILMVPR